MEQRYAVLVRVERGDRFNKTRTWICFTPQAGVKVVTETFEFSCGSHVWSNEVMLDRSLNGSEAAEEFAG